MKAMSLEEFNELNELIANYYSLIPRVISRGKRRVKYMQSTIDFRTNGIFHIRIYGASVDKEFPTVNQWRNHPKTLRERVMMFLNGEEDTWELENIKTKESEDK